MLYVEGCGIPRLKVIEDVATMAVDSTVVIIMMMLVVVVVVSSKAGVATIGCCGSILLKSLYVHVLHYMV